MNRNIATFDSQSFCEETDPASLLSGRGRFGDGMSEESFRNSVKNDTDLLAVFVMCRVPAVYLSWPNRACLRCFSFNGINSLRIFKVAFSSIPTAPTKRFCFQSVRSLPSRQLEHRC
jgi:hypothetical protein